MDLLIKCVLMGFVLSSPVIICCLIGKFDKNLGPMYKEAVYVMWILGLFSFLLGASIPIIKGW